MNQRIQGMIEAAQYHDEKCARIRTYDREHYAVHRKTAFENRKLAREELTEQ